MGRGKDADAGPCPEKESGGAEEASAALPNQNLRNFTANDKELLVFLVKEIQKAKCQGSAGDWHLYLETVAKSSKFNPAAHSWEVLAGFIGTLTGVPSVKLIRRLKKWFAKRKAAEEMDRTDQCPDTAEQRLVLRTRAHPVYRKTYDLPSHAPGWIVSGRGATKQFCKPERLISLDCEMCLSVDGVKEVIKACVVDRDLNVLLSTDVRPTLEVGDYCTEFTGINAENLGKDGIVSFLELQSRMAALLTPGTILIGHGLHHDLRALKIDHARVIDTSLLFRFKDMEQAVPGLSLVCKTLLKETMRDGSSKVHDCLQDAIIPMKLVLHELANGPTPLLGVAAETVSEEDQRKLFVHRILKGVSESAIQAVIPSGFACKVEQIKWSTKGFGTTYVSFKTVKDTELAFSQIRGCLNEDGCGKLQKAVPITVPGQGIASVIHFRKMTGQQQPLAHLQSPAGKPAEQKNMVNQREKERFLRGTTVFRVDLRGNCEIVSEDGRGKMQLEHQRKEHSDGEMHALERGRSRKAECNVHSRGEEGKSEKEEYNARSSSGKEGLPKVVSDKKRKSVEDMAEKNSGSGLGERKKKRVRSGRSKQ
ncbi:hypothetical protein CBR_g16947 [Chara braunii]|uniref:Exonuclease domain-containing protein n=1 Tax=Chara braunii TaxID=69332 RepID=A0A388KU62_CHABU|nr:hypothetical protein CBR_g16947 [Chara braunii]|eukprot:GBG73604.1 hypothetical protein CBR_g16947 [Chara braunii]